MPEETSYSGTGDRPEDFARRLDRIEREFLRESRWWRGGLIAALLLIAIAIFAAGHHRHRRHRGPGMGMGMAGPMMGMPMPGPNMPYGAWGPSQCGHEPGCSCGGGPGMRGDGGRRHGDRMRNREWGQADPVDPSDSSDSSEPDDAPAAPRG